MNRLFLISSIFVLIFGPIQTLDQKICEKIPKLNEKFNSFKSKSIFHYRGQAYHIEEIQQGNRGKLIVTLNNEVKEIYYEKNVRLPEDIQQADELNLVIYNRQKQDCDVLTNKTKIRPHINRPYEFYNPKTGIYGPSALWSLIGEKISDFRLANEQKGFRDRGISVHVCQPAAKKQVKIVGKPLMKEKSRKSEEEYDDPSQWAEENSSDDDDDYTTTENSSDDDDEHTTTENLSDDDDDYTTTENSSDDDHDYDDEIEEGGKIVLEGLGETSVNLIIADLDWKIFDQVEQDVPQPIELTVKSSESIPEDSNIPFSAKIEYLTFEEISEKESEDLKLHEFDSNEDYWITPSICKPFADREPFFTIPEMYELEMDEINVLETNSNESPKESKEESAKSLLGRKRILIDKIHNFKLIEEDDSNLIQIYKPKDKILFEQSKDTYCHSLYNEDMSKNVNVEFLNLLEEFIQNRGKNYSLVGNQLVRNMVANVYRQISYLDSEKKLVQVVELYMSEVQDKPLTHKPVQLRVMKYKIEDESHILESSLIFNIYTFETIENENKLVDALDVSQCVDRSMVANFNLIASKEKKETERNIEKERFGKLLRESLIKTSEGLSILNFPKIEIREFPTEVIVDLRFIDIVSPLAYFEESNEILPVNKTQETEPNAKSAVECAISSLKSDSSSGFQFCKASEHTSAYCSLLPSIDPFVNGTDDNCEIKMKRKDLETDFKFVTFNEKMKALKEAVSNLNIKVENYDHDDKDYVFDRIHLNKEEALIDRSQLYKRERNGQKFKDNMASKLINLEDGNQNPAACHEACTDPLNDFSCDSFSFCRQGSDATNCQLGNVMMREDEKKMNKNDFFEKDSACDVYNVSLIKNFKQHINQKLDLSAQTSTIISVLDDATDNDCAAYCLDHNRKNANNKRCLSIEICGGSKTNCKLSTVDTLWEKKGTMAADSGCNVYSVSHVLNYHPISFKVLENFVSKEVDSIDQCATTCDLAGDCDTFNYCDAEPVRTCRYLSNGGTHATAKDSDNLGCVTYVHRKKLIGPPLDERVVQPTGVLGGYSVGGTFGFMFLFLLIGVLVGAPAFYGYTHYLETRSQSDSDDVGVAFSSLREAV